MKSSTKKVLGEFIASAFIAFFGLGFVIPFAVTGGVSNMYEFSVWFGGVFAIAVVIFAPICGCHVNPGVTFAWALFGGFEKKLILPYCIAQILGWGAGVAPLYIIYNGAIKDWVAEKAGNPATLFYCNTKYIWGGAGLEFAMSVLLMISIFVLLDSRIPNRPTPALFPFAIGGIIAIDIAFGGTFTGTAINPARDFGPRIAGYIYGLINGYDVSSIFAGGQWIMYLLAPTIGCVVGGWLYFKVIVKLLPSTSKESE